jgi:CHASE1-domain containing sensor protein
MRRRPRRRRARPRLQPQSLSERQTTFRDARSANIPEPAQATLRWLGPVNAMARKLGCDVMNAIIVR